MGIILNLLLLVIGLNISSKSLVLKNQFVSKIYNNIELNKFKKISRRLIKKKNFYKKNQFIWNSKSTK